MGNAEWKSDMQDMQETVRVLILKKKKKSVDGHFASVKYMSETYWTEKLNREYYGVDKYWVVDWDLKLTGWGYDF